jgi:hypothetical protein
VYVYPMGGVLLLWLVSLLLVNISQLALAIYF